MTEKSFLPPSFLRSSPLLQISVAGGICLFGHCDTSSFLSNIPFGDDRDWSGEISGRNFCRGLGKIFREVVSEGLHREFTGERQTSEVISPCRKIRCRRIPHFPSRNTRPEVGYGRSVAPIFLQAEAHNDRECLETALPEAGLVKIQVPVPKFSPNIKSQATTPISSNLKTEVLKPRPKPRS